MKKEIVYCKALKLSFLKSVWQGCCHQYNCAQCPELRPKPTKTIRPPDFADLYIEGKIDLPVLHNISYISEIAAMSKKEAKKEGVSESFIKRYKTKAENEISKLKQNKLSTLKGLSPSLENKIYIALYEFLQAINASEGTALKKLNRKITEQRKKIIHYFEKVLKLRYPFLLKSTIEAIEIELDRLKKIGKDKYHPIKELELYKEIKQPSIRVGLLGDAVSYKESDKIIEKLVSPRMTVKIGRPSDLFPKALQVVVYRLLHEQVHITIGKAKTLTAEIINEYLTKHDRQDIATLTIKDIDNSLHST